MKKQRPSTATSLRPKDKFQSPKTIQNAETNINALLSNMPVLKKSDIKFSIKTPRRSQVSETQPIIGMDLGQIPSTTVNKKAPTLTASMVVDS